MSELFYSERGNVVPTLCEELTHFRRVRKLLDLPTAHGPAALYVLARAYAGSPYPLHVAVNGQEIEPIQPNETNIYQWYSVSLPASILVPGENVFEFWTDSRAMNAWSLGLENGHAAPRSFLSTDSGATWRNETMGYLHVSRGEYIVRVRVSEGNDPPPPDMVWEDPSSPRLRHLRTLIPPEVVDAATTLERVRRLTTWVTTSWEYKNTSNGIPYSPWDPETILAWGKAGLGHNALPPVVMCVHYGVTLASCCLALGIPARCAAFTGAINGFNGHFTAEVWLEDIGKWVMVDPTIDAMLFRNGVPLSVSEIQQAEEPLADLVRFGPGRAYQVQNPLIEPWIPENFLQGICFRHRSVWPRMDFLTHPELTPSGHGSTSYCETLFVWEARDLDEGFGMFPSFGAPEYFDAPPADFPRREAERLPVAPSGKA